MSLSVQQFIANNNGKLINNRGIQCVALANQYEQDVVGGYLIGTPLTGYAKDLFNNFGNEASSVNYVRLGSGDTAQLGDLAVWNAYNGNGLPHVALVMSDLGNNLKCFTQNPGAAHVETLTKNGLLGYLRPKKFVTQAPAPASVPNAPVGPNQYRVQPGDTLSAIGAKFGVDYNLIAQASGIADVNKINSGQILNIPQSAAPAPPSTRVTYTVQPGDMLSVIGERYGVDYHVIAQQSGIANPDLIHPGDVLVIHP